MPIPSTDGHRVVTRAVAIGAMIATLGPLFGFAAVFVWVLLDRGADAALYLLRLPDAVVTPYLFGGLPAGLAGLAVAWSVRRHGGVSIRFWLAATAIFALVPSAVFLVINEPPPAAMLFITDEEIAAMYVVATVFASLSLRLLLGATSLRES